MHDDENKNHGNDSDNEKESIRVTEEKGIIYMDLDKIKTPQNPPFQLNTDVYDTLLSKVQGDISKVYCLLARYESLEGKGFQAALPSQVFAIMAEKMELTTECFASPLNHYLDKYW